MPQKKNPDVLELIRAKYHVLLGEEFKVKSLIANLISGYNRDMQETKEPVIKSMNITAECLKITAVILKEITFDTDKCNDAITDEMQATKEAYQLVKKGNTFRDAYKIIGMKYSNK